MIEFSVPDTLEGTGTVSIYGSVDVPDGFAPYGVGDTASGEILDFDLRISAHGQDMEDPDFWATEHPILQATLNTFTSVYYGQVDVQLGIARTNRSLYLRYNNFEQFLTGGKATSIYNVTLDARPKKNLAVSKHTKRGRFV